MFTLRLLGGASLDGSDGPITGRAALRQRIALLALLAVEHPRPISRDKLVAFLWPDSGSGEARHLLRESLYILRSALGEDSLLSTGDDVRLNPDRVTCDLWEFEAALARDDPESAVAQYHGPFLSGFHLSDAEDFDRWADGERTRLGRRYGQALEQLAERQMQGGDPVRAVEWWSRLAGEDPYNSRIALRYMQALESAGDRAGALRYAKAHSDLLREELDAAPEAEVVALAESLRLESRAVPSSAPALPNPISAAETADRHGQDLLAIPVAAPTRRERGRGWVLSAMLILGVAGGLGALAATHSRARSPMLAHQRVAVTRFENRTGRPELDNLGALASDWIIRGLMETPLFNATEVEAVYARAEDSAGMMVRGSYYIIGDSVLFQAGIMDVASGRMLRSIDPVGAPLDRASGAFEALRERIAAALSPLVNAFNRGSPIDPDLVPPPSLAAYREFVLGLKQGRFGDWETEAEHYRRAARMDSTFVAPLIQLAYRATIYDQCSITDSVGATLEPRRDRLTTWNRMTIYSLRALCQGDVTEALRLMEQRYQAYPRSASALAHYAWVLLHANQPRAAREMMGRLDPERDMGWAHSPQEVWPRYWWRLAGSRHALGEFRAELDITEQWHDSTASEWQVTRGRALAALGREEAVLELLGTMAGASVDASTDPQLTIAGELAAHGHLPLANVVAESVLARLEREPIIDAGRASAIAWANRLLGRTDQERAALERLAGSEADTLTKLEARGRIAVLLGDTTLAQKIDRSLAGQSDLPLQSPWARAPKILARAHIAAGFGRRDSAVALLQDAGARGLFDLGSAHAFHTDLLLAPLRGYPPFDALLKPAN